ncbi:MAG: hypothetical protein LIP08_14625 [Bacteroides sp.]|nr:hypothetical protein [Bacteroides sp.]
MVFLWGAMPVRAQENKEFEQAVRMSVERAMQRYPKSTLKDLYKLFFQDRYGPGHLIHDREGADRYLRRELDSYTAPTPVISVEEAVECTGWQHNFYRIDLSVLKNEWIPYDVFFDAFVRSVNGITPMPVEEWREEWRQIETIIRSMQLSLPGYAEDYREIEEKLTAGNYVGHHSEAYNQAYAPHYRIISRKICEEEILPLLEK